MADVRPDVVLWCAKQRFGDKPAWSGLRQLLDCADPSMRLIFVSSDGVLPGTTGDYDEQAAPLTMHVASPLAKYTNAKITAERMICSSFHNHCIVRTGPIYGRTVSGAWGARVSKLLVAFRQGEPVDRATNIRRTFSWVDDAAKSLIELAGIDYRGVIHFGPPESNSYFEFAKAVCRVFGFPEPLVRPSVVSDEEVRAGAIRKDTSLNTSLVQRILPHSFRPLSAGLLESYRGSA